MPILINEGINFGSNTSGGGGASSVDILTDILVSSEKEGIVGSNIFVEKFIDPDNFVVSFGNYNIEKGVVYIP